MATTTTKHQVPISLLGIKRQIEMNALSKDIGAVLQIEPKTFAFQVQCLYHLTTTPSNMVKDNAKFWEIWKLGE